MAKPALFLDRVPAQGSKEESYRPIPIPPKGMVVAWGLTGALILYNLALVILGRGPGVVSAGMAILLGVIALLITFGRWNEARTVVRVGEAGICYDSGVRHSRMDWGEVRELQVRRRGHGHSVVVIGPASHFRFFTQAPIGLRGLDGTQPQSGFPEGEQLAVTIIQRAGLKLAYSSDEGRVYGK